MVELIDGLAVGQLLGNFPCLSLKCSSSNGGNMCVCVRTCVCPGINKYNIYNIYNKNNNIYNNNYYCTHDDLQLSMAIIKLRMGMRLHTAEPIARDCPPFMKTMTARSCHSQAQDQSLFIVGRR